MPYDKAFGKRGLNSFGKYLDMLHQDRTGDMAAEMVNCLTTNYTYFTGSRIISGCCRNGSCRSLWNAGSMADWISGAPAAPPEKNAIPWPWCWRNAAGQINTWEIYGSWRRIFQGMPWIKRRRANIRPRNWKSFHWNGRKNTVRRLMTEPFR